MKNFNLKLMVLLAGVCLMAVGCGKSNSTQDGSSDLVNSNIDTTPVTAPTTPGGTTSGSNTVTFTPVSITELSNYVGTHSLNAPTNIQMTVSLSDQGGAHYGGSVQISYTDVGIRYNGNFQSGTGMNPNYDSLKDNSKYQAQYNTWYTQNGAKVFTGMFQDQWGAIVLVIDNVVNAGDGQGGGYVTGSVYYRNFAYSYATQSPYRKCWFIYEGPFDCRSSSVINKTSTVPDGYIKLGTFSGLNIAASFK